MTVRELIEKLRELPGEMEVYFTDNEPYGCQSTVRNVTVGHCPLSGGELAVWLEN